MPGCGRRRRCARRRQNRSSGARARLLYAAWRGERSGWRCRAGNGRAWPTGPGLDGCGKLQLSTRRGSGTGRALPPTKPPEGHATGWFRAVMLDRRNWARTATSIRSNYHKNPATGSLAGDDVVAKIARSKKSKDPRRAAASKACGGFCGQHRIQRVRRGYTEIHWMLERTLQAAWDLRL